MLCVLRAIQVQWTLLAVEPSALLQPVWDSFDWHTASVSIQPERVQDFYSRQSSKLWCAV